MVRGDSGAHNQGIISGAHYARGEWCPVDVLETSLYLAIAHQRPSGHTAAHSQTGLRPREYHRRDPVAPLILNRFSSFVLSRCRNICNAAC